MKDIEYGIFMPVGSGGWIPSGNIPELDASYRYAVRLRLGLAPSDTLPLTCACGASLVRDRNHFLVCRLLVRTAMTSRHDHIVRTCATVARATGAEVLVEPDFDGGRPDAEVAWAEGVDFVDVRVTHPGASALRSAQRPLGAAAVQERRKNRRYAELARNVQALFVPLVFETYGAFAEGTQDYVGKLALGRLSQPDGVDLPDQRAPIMQRLAVALQNGNARVQEEGLRRARGAAGGDRAPRMLGHPDYIFQLRPPRGGRG